MTPNQASWYSHPSGKSPRWFEIKEGVLGYWAFSNDKTFIYFRWGPHSSDWERNIGTTRKEVDPLYRDLLKKRTQFPIPIKTKSTPLFTLLGKQ